MFFSFLLKSSFPPPPSASPLIIFLINFTHSFFYSLNFHLNQAENKILVTCKRIIIWPDVLIDAFVFELRYIFKILQVFLGCRDSNIGYYFMTISWHVENRLQEFLHVFFFRNLFLGSQ